MTVKLYLKDPYMKKFKAKVVSRGKDYIILDQTAFYPTSGGQEHDTGKINGINVIKVKRNNDDIRHYTDGMIGSDIVEGEIDWDRRYKLMKMHTAQHIISGILAKRYKVKTYGVQIKPDESGIHIDKLNVNMAVKTDILEDFKQATLKKLDIKSYEIDRNKALSDIDPLRLAGIQKLPASLKTLRVIEIPGFDKCTCAGTHVKNTRELGEVEVSRVEQEEKGTVIFFRLF